MQAIGRALGRSVSTISRKIQRNSHPVLGYRPYGAHRAATAARARPKDSKLAEPGDLHDYVKSKLLTHWSPQQISKLLIKEIPDDEQMRVSHETMYQALRAAWRLGVLREAEGRGGAAYVHDELKPGTKIQVPGPRNNFVLEPAAGFVFIAGGIGLTPCCRWPARQPNAECPGGRCTWAAAGNR